MVGTIGSDDWRWVRDKNRGHVDSGILSLPYAKHFPTGTTDDYTRGDHGHRLFLGGAGMEPLQ